jgi:hypothetical protein
MGYQYLHVNTRHLPTSDTSSYNITLEKPLKNVTHVEVMSFSTQNDFFNIHKDNNEFKFLFRGGNLDTTLTDTHAIYDMSFSIKPAFYTHTELVDKMNTVMNESDYADAGQTDISLGVVLRPDLSIFDGASGDFPIGSVAKKVRIRFSVSNGKTVITVDTPPAEPAQAINYGFMSYYFKDIDEFENSIYRRLGFKKNQVFFQAESYNTNEELLEQTIVTATVKFNANYDLLAHTGGNILGNEFVYVSNANLPKDELQKLFIYEKCFQLASPQRSIKSSHGLGWETHEALIISSDLVDDYQSTTHNYKDTGRAEQTNQLIKVPVTTNRASWIHYISRESEAIHVISKSYIQSIKLTMKSIHSTKTFQTNEFNSFAITLRFTIKNDEDSDASIRQYESYQRGAIQTQNERV